jgi:hypothetical protein
MPKHLPAMRNGYDVVALVQASALLDIGKEELEYRLSSCAERWLLLEELDTRGAIGHKQVREMRELKVWMRIDV